MRTCLFPWQLLVIWKKDVVFDFSARLRQETTVRWLSLDACYFQQLLLPRRTELYTQSCWFVKLWIKSNNLGSSCNIIVSCVGCASRLTLIGSRCIFVAVSLLVLSLKLGIFLPFSWACPLPDETRRNRVQRYIAKWRMQNHYVAKKYVTGILRLEHQAFKAPLETIKWPVLGPSSRIVILPFRALRRHEHYALSYEMKNLTRCRMLQICYSMRSSPCWGAIPHLHAGNDKWQVSACPWQTNFVCFGIPSARKRAS